MSVAVLAGLAALPADADLWQAYESPYAVIGRHVARSPLGGYVLSSGEGLAKTDETGAIEWSKDYAPAAGNMALEHVAVAADGSIFVVGNAGSFQTWGLRLDACGELLSWRWLGAGLPEGVAAAADGFVIASGGDVLAVDADGVPRWRARGSNLYVRDVGVLPDGRIVAAGIEGGGSGPVGCDVAVFEATDGSLVSRTHLIPPGRMGQVAKLAVLPGGDVAVAVQTSESLPSTELHLWVMRIRLPSGVVWSRWVHGAGGSQPEAVVALDDGTIGILAYGGWDANPGASWILGMTPDGDVAWQRGMRARFHGSSATSGPPSGGLVISGYGPIVGTRVRGFVAGLSKDGWCASPVPGVHDVSGCVESLVACSEPGSPFMLAAGTDMRLEPCTVTEGRQAIVVDPVAPCPPVTTRAICVGARSEPSAVTLQLEHDGGVGAVTVSWDLDGDGTPDASGNPAVVALPAGTRSVTATASDSCASGSTSDSRTTTIDVPASAPADPTDGDGDGACDTVDVCPTVPDPLQRDTDRDGLGDACDDDDDDDGVADAADDCPLAVDPGQQDQDGDLHADACDTCPLVADSGQEDADGDAVGDACDDCPAAWDPLQQDVNANAVGDACDPACDEPSALDHFPGAEPLRVRRLAAGLLELTWEDVPGRIVDVLVGDLDALVPGGRYTHVRSTVVGVTGGRSPLPMPSTDAYLLVQSRCGRAGSSLGRDSNGGERPRPCP